MNLVIHPLYSSGVISSYEDKVGQSDFDYANDDIVDCPTIVTAEEDGMGWSAKIKSSLCPCSNDIRPQDLPLHPRHDHNPLHPVDLISPSTVGINKNLSGPEP